MGKGRPGGNPNISKYGFGTRPKEVDDEFRSRVKGVKKTFKWTKDKCSTELEEILDILKKILREDEKIEVGNPKKLKQETVRDSITLMNKILDYMKYLYPPVQENINVNVDITSDIILERLRHAKENKIIEIKKDAQK